MPAFFHQWLDRVPDLLGLARRNPGAFPYLLESAATGKLGGHSLLLHAGEQLLVAQPGSGLSGPGTGESFFARLDDWYRAERVAGPLSGVTGPAPPFVGGWFVYLGYEIAAEIEPTLALPAAEPGLPAAVAHRCHGAVIVFHGGEGDAGDRAMAVGESRAVLDEVLERVMAGCGQAPGAAAEPDPPLESIEEEDPARFKASVQRVHEYLRAGDVFQVNISRPWTGRFRTAPNPYRLYQSLRRANPAPFAGLMHWRQLFLLSSSPERLVQVRGRAVQTRPIAGTRPRGRDLAHDRTLSAELLSNLKERAEHVMLIDLERNDLGRVCRPGTVEVSELMAIETYAHVHHIVSNVRGELAEWAGPVDAMKAVFPGGTITGCPKVRCMEIIAELEGEGRGFYTGSMGYLGRDGSMDMNILIRSMLVNGRQFSFRTGAGIVADSDADREVEETADKARGMLLALESHGREKEDA